MNDLIFGSAKERGHYGDSSSRDLVAIQCDSDAALYTPLSHTTATGTHLRGYHIAPLKREGANDRICALFFSGSHAPAEHAYFAFAHALFMEKKYEVIFFNYPGFGESGGTPSVEGLKETADAAYREARRRNIEECALVAYGYSLGCYPAAYFACRYRAAHLALDAPFESFRQESQRRIERTAETYIGSGNPTLKIGAITLGSIFLATVAPSTLLDLDTHRLLEKASQINGERNLTLVDRALDAMCQASKEKFAKTGSNFAKRQEVKTNVDHRGKGAINGAAYRTIDFHDHFKEVDLVPTPHRHLQRRETSTAPSPPLRSRPSTAPHPATSPPQLSPRDWPSPSPAPQKPSP